MIIDGQRAIERAHAGKFELRELFLSDAHWAQLSDEQHRWLSALASDGVDQFSLPEALLQRIGYGGRADQWVATAEAPVQALGGLSLRDQPLIAVLECVEKPGNLGAVLRSADATGVHALIVADGQTDLYNPNAIRASLGTIFSVPLFAASTPEVIEWLRAREITTFVARVDGSQNYDLADFRQSTAIVLGSEAMGVSAAWKSDEWQGIRLPMRGQADSLNVSNTAAVIFYEAVRQRA